MGGTAVPTINGGVLQHSNSYVQINIYDTNIKELQDRGVDIKHMLSTGNNSMVNKTVEESGDMDVTSFEDNDSNCNETVVHDGIYTTLATSFTDSNISVGNIVREGCCGDPRSCQKGQDIYQVTERPLQHEQSRPTANHSNYFYNDSKLLTKDITPENNATTFQDCQEVVVDIPPADDCVNAVTSSELPSSTKNATLPRVQTNSGSHWSSLTSDEVVPVEDSGEIDDITEADLSFTSFSREVVSALQSINPTSSLFMGNIVFHDELDQQCHSSSIEVERFVSKRQESQESANSRETSILNSERCVFRTADIDEESVYNTGISRQSYIAGKEDVVEDIVGNELPPLSSLTLGGQELNEKLDSSPRSPSEIVSLRNSGLENAFSMQSATAERYVRRKRARSISEDSEGGATITPKEGSPNDINHHHKNVHRDSPYMGALSIETREDLDELLVLWNQCFPDGFAQFEGESVSHDSLQQFHMDQCAENEMEIKRKKELTKCVIDGTAMDESDCCNRHNVVHENDPVKARIPSYVSFADYLDASSSEELSVTLSFSAICSAFGRNSFLQSMSFSKSSEGPNFVTNEFESKKLDGFPIAESTTTVECGLVEEDVQGLFPDPDIVHEEFHVDENGKSVFCKLEEVELRVSFSKFSHDLESVSNIGTRAVQNCTQTVRRPAFGSMCKVFVDFKESVVDDKKTDYSRNNYVVMRRMSLVPKSYHCKIEGCKRRIRLRYGYGKQRLLEHVRAHWGKLLKKCKLCTFRASHAYKVYYHHKCKHSGSDFFQAESLETKEDMKELLQIWKLCFDGVWFSSIVSYLQHLLLQRVQHIGFRSVIMDIPVLGSAPLKFSVEGSVRRAKSFGVDTDFQCVADCYQTRQYDVQQVTKHALQYEPNRSLTENLNNLDNKLLSKNITTAAADVNIFQNSQESMVNTPAIDGYANASLSFECPLSPVNDTAPRVESCPKTPLSSSTSPEEECFEDIGNFGGANITDQSFISFSREIVSGLQSINATPLSSLGDDVICNELNQQCCNSEHKSHEGIKSRNICDLELEDCVLGSVEINEENVCSSEVGRRSDVADKGDVVEDIDGNQLLPHSSIKLEVQELGEALSSSHRSSCEVVSLQNANLENGVFNEADGDPITKSGGSKRSLRRKRARPMSNDSVRATLIS
ncbi:unnamed protein product [Angiostrongylus costaricensis]|uniref:C2H2-type domain-containing protein n=1 Tax=Angiostrongylus costaricensis TaxID=334426 RepID=A0A158PDI2_ANGCS|nr:unnamed protein product [Angiostrongylus costaricensis]